jgi:hypothetical protein
MADLTDQEQAAYRAMIAAGMMPHMALDALRDARAAGQRLPTDAEIRADAQMTPEKIAESLAWAVWNPAVPLRFKLLLMARAQAGANA